MRRSRLWLIGVVLLGIVGLLMLGGVGVVGFTIGASIGFAHDDRSVACGTFIVRCFAGVTVQDFENDLTSHGYTCKVVNGVEHSVHRCGGADGAVVDIVPDGSLASSVMARSPDGAPVDRSRILFETVAQSPFPDDPVRARRAASWVDASLDGSEHSTTIAGYRYQLIAHPWSVLTILA